MKLLIQLICHRYYNEATVLLSCLAIIIGILSIQKQNELPVKKFTSSSLVIKYEIIKTSESKR